MRQIPFAQPQFDGNEHEYLAACLRSSWISSSSDFIHRLETALTRALFRPTQVCSSGTAALHLALLALGLNHHTRDSSVIVPTLAFGALANVVIHAGGRPVFVDCRDDFQINPNEVRALADSANPDIHSIIAVHTYGASCHTAALKEISLWTEIPLIEDCAEAMACTDWGIGRIGNAATWSFYANKVMTTGEGGAVSGLDISLWRNHGMARAGEYEHDVAGLNYRMTGLQAAIGLAQVERLNELRERHRSSAAIYRDKLSDCGMTSPDARWTWTYPIRVGDGLVRYYTEHLKTHFGIETRRVFRPLHWQEPYRRYVLPDQRFPVAERLYREYLCLPTGVSAEDANYIADAVLAVRRNKSAA